jgi:hypothetical protein
LFYWENFAIASAEAEGGSGSRRSLNTPMAQWAFFNQRTTIGSPMKPPPNRKHTDGTAIGTIASSTEPCPFIRGLSACQSQTAPQRPPLQAEADSCDRSMDLGPSRGHSWSKLWWEQSYDHIATFIDLSHASSADLSHASSAALYCSAGPKS